jgi:hypothetical protein
MIGRDSDFDADGVRLRPSVGDATGGLVRTLGAFERMFHLNELKSTKHFCVVAELADDLDPAALGAGLLAVQRRHPLLNVYVEDHPQTRLGFYRPASVPPIPVTVVDAETGCTWGDLVAEELTRPFDRCCAPMTRVALLRSGPSTPAAIVLTVDHAIVDGLSAAYLLRDAQQAAAPALNSSPPPAQPDWLATPSTIRPFDGALPHVSAVGFDDDLTRRLVTRARAERTTVHSALVSAMSQAIIESGRNEFVRMLTPIDIRTHLGVGDDICLYISATCTAFARQELTDLWDMARTIGDQLADARSVPTLFAASAATEQFIPVDATTQDAEDFVVGGLSFEAFASNLGVLDMGTPLVARPVAIWGPAILGQVQGELSAGICTFNGQLRIVCASHDPFADYLDRVRDVLDAACKGGVGLPPQLRSEAATIHARSTGTSSE